MKTWLHVLFQALGFIVSAGTLLTSAVPPKVQPYVVLAVSAAQGLLAWYNHYFTPGGQRIK